MTSFTFKYISISEVGSPGHTAAQCCQRPSPAPPALPSISGSTIQKGETLEKSHTTLPTAQCPALSHVAKPHCKKS